MNEAEIIEIWEACENLGYPFGALVQLSLLTAQRRTEVATMRWQDIDEKNQTWHLPRESTKNNRAHEILIPDYTLKLLRSFPKHKDGIYVFSADGKYPFSNFGKAKAELDKIINKNRQESRKNSNIPE